jgi:AAT family amino acid transporter/GABA permease
MFLIACIVPWSSIVTGHSPFVAALETMRIPGAADIMNAIVLVAVLSALNSGLYVSSRILFRLAERGDAPKSLLKLTPNKVPRLAVLLSSLVGYVAIVAAIVSPQGVFLFLVWLFPWLSYAVVAAIAGVLAAMGADPALRPQLMASAASLAVASAAFLLTAKREPRSYDGCATGYLSPIGQQAMEGRK